MPTSSGLAASTSLNTERESARGSLSRFLSRKRVTFRLSGARGGRPWASSGGVRHAYRWTRSWAMGGRGGRPLCLRFGSPRPWRWRLRSLGWLWTVPRFPSFAMRPWPHMMSGGLRLAESSAGHGSGTVAPAVVLRLHRSWRGRLQSATPLPAVGAPPMRRRLWALLSSSPTAAPVLVSWKMAPASSLEVASATT